MDSDNLNITSVDERRVDAELIRLLHQQSVTALIGGFAVAACLIAINWSADLLPMVFWIICYVGISGIRWWLWYDWRGTITDDSVALHWRSLMLTALGVSGVVWAGAAFMFLNHDNPVTSMIVILVLTMLLTGAVGSLAPVVESYYVYSLPLALTVGWHVLFAENFLPVLAVAYIMFALICAQYARSVNRSLRETTRLRFEKDELVAELRHQSRLLAEKAEQANRATEAKTRFLSVASHDLAQPLHALALFMNALSKEDIPERRERLIVSASNSTRILSDMFSILLDFSRIESDVIDTDVQAVPLVEIFRQLENEFHARADEKGLSFISYPLDVIVQTDPTLLQRILRNLLSNALAATEKGEISLAAVSEGNNVLITVSDTGSGIEPELQEKIFEEHFHGDSSVGLGLGLSLVRRLSELLDIEVNVDSQPGVGSTFSLTVKALQAAKEPVAQRSTRAIPPGLRILFIEDDEHSKQAMKAVFEQWASVFHLATGCDDLKDLDFVPDIIISDYRLSPTETAMDVLEFLKAQFNPVPPFLVVTGETSPGVFEYLREHSIDALRKPADMSQLEAWIVEALTTPEPTRWP